MRRGKIGDLYAVKMPNGYKLYQWAFRIPKYGDYIRVFKGLYKSIPDNLSDIVNGPHSFLISFFSNKAYRIGLAEFLANFPVTISFPKYAIYFFQNMKGEIPYIRLIPTSEHRYSEELEFCVNRISDLPAPYNSETLLYSCISPDWLLYLFDKDFDLSDLKEFFPGLPGTDYAIIVKKYTDIIEKFLNNDRLIKNK